MDGVLTVPDQPELTLVATWEEAGPCSCSTEDQAYSVLPAVPEPMGKVAAGWVGQQLLVVRMSSHAASR